MAKRSTHTFQRKQRERERKEKVAVRLEKKKARSQAAKERAAGPGGDDQVEPFEQAVESSDPATGEGGKPDGQG